MFISQTGKENGSLTKIEKTMKTSDLIYSSNHEINKKLSTTINPISDLMWKSISTSILCPTLYSFQDSVGHSVKNFIWRATQNSSQKLIEELNPTVYFFQDSAGHSIRNSMWNVVKNSSKILISNLNEKHSHSPVASNE